MKRFLLGFASSALKSLLLFTAIVTSISIVFGTSVAIKTALDDSKIYDSFVDNALANIQQQSKSNPNSSGQEAIPPEFKTAVQASFTPDMLKNTAEQIIDGTYRWLDGKTPTPDFRIDLTSAKNALGANLGNYAANRFNALPACTKQQSAELSSEIDALNIKCRPAGLNTNAIKQEVTNQFANNPDFLGEPIINVDSLPKDESGKNIFEKLQQVPKLFGILKNSGWILGGLTALLVLLQIFLRHDKRAGVKSVGISFLTSGIFLVLSTLLVIYLFNKSSSSSGILANSGAENAFQASLITILKSLSKIFNQILIKFGVGYIVSGVIVLIYLHFTDKKAVNSTVSDASIASQGTIPTGKGPDKK